VLALFSEVRPERSAGTLAKAGSRLAARPLRNWTTSIGRPFSAENFAPLSAAPSLPFQHRVQKESAMSRAMRSSSNRGRIIGSCWVVAILVTLSAGRAFAQAQDDSNPNQTNNAEQTTIYVPPTARDRLNWTITGTVGGASIATGVFVASWNTAWNLPSEWGRSWEGFGKRFAAREAQITISNTIESSLGAAWGEDPRYRRSNRTGLRARTAYATTSVFVAPRRNGRMAPAWARYFSAIGSNLIANTWLPTGSTTTSQNLRRIGNGLLGRFVGNMWQEFWPDVRRRFNRNDDARPKH